MHADAIGPAWLRSSFASKRVTPDPNHPITDLDATFTATKPEDTYAVMHALRLAGINYDVTVNGSKDDPKDQAFDIFWFRKEDDQEFIGRIVKGALSRKEQTP